MAQGTPRLCRNISPTKRKEKRDWKKMGESLSDPKWPTNQRKKEKTWIIRTKRAKKPGRKWQKNIARNGRGRGNKKKSAAQYTLPTL